MTTYAINLKRQRKQIHTVPLVQHASAPDGTAISFTNYFMELNGQPFFGVSGEFHFSRYPRDQWETEIVKMKMGGINIVSSYIFWIHHEEDEGNCRWDGNLDVRAFVDLCAKHGLYVIVRVGPFVHGECRNGGFPDWLYGRPFELRSNDDGYLDYVRNWFNAIGPQLRGQFFQEGGPIIGVQLENEFMHASAPWEVVPRLAHEWVPGGSGGLDHMRALKQLAQDADLCAPIYTSTAWGGSPVLEDELLPLYGGYAFCPWLVDEHRPVHPPTTEYLFQDFHNNGTDWIGPPPLYPPEAYPFACCEMGGGMQTWYRYRFVVPPASVEAMALVKVAGGCNFVGYYMFHGGSNPVGQHAFLNEHVTPKISYDFQAPIGEFGQVRESYHRLKLLHLFLTEFAPLLCPMATVLPEGNSTITPENTESLRFAARVAGRSGFIFLNNFQDHVLTRDHHDVRLTLELADETIILPRRQGLTLKRDVCAILPFNLDLQGVSLTYATTQLVTRLHDESTTTYFFFAPEGIESEYCFDRHSFVGLAVESGTVDYVDGHAFVHVEPGKRCRIRLTSAAGHVVVISTVTRDQALQLWKVDVWGQERVMLTDADLLASDGKLALFSGDPRIELSLFPDVQGGLAGPDGQVERAPDGLFAHYALSVPAVDVPLIVTRVAPGKAVVRVPEEMFAPSVSQLADVLLRIWYRGDVGYASISGRLMNDNFANGAAWEIGLRRFASQIRDRNIDIYIAPTPAQAASPIDSPMAAQPGHVAKETAEIVAIEAVPRYQACVTRGATSG